MDRAQPLLLDLSGMPFAIGVDDDRIRPLLERLWHPFVVTRTSSPPIPVRLSIHDDSMPYFQLGEEERAYGIDLWTAMFAARLHMVQKALVKARERSVYLHSAVLEKDGAGTLLAGAYGTGKTTFALELLRRGWRLLSDDVALIDPVTLGIDWFPKPLGIKGGDWDDFEHHWDPPPAWLPRPAGAFLLPATAFPLSRRVDRVETLVFLKLDKKAEPRVVDLSPARAAILAAECSGDIALDSLGTLAAVAEGASGRFELTHAATPAGLTSLLRLLGEN